MKLQKRSNSKVGRVTIKILKYADDKVLVENDWKELEFMATSICTSRKKIWNKNKYEHDKHVLAHVKVTH